MNDCSAIELEDCKVGKNEMENNEDAQTEILREDSLRATLLGLALRTFGDDFLELVDRTGPHKQALETALWTTAADETEEKEVALRAIFETIQEELEELGMRGLLIIASEDKLLEEQRQIRKRLYGET